MAEEGAESMQFNGRTHDTEPQSQEGMVQINPEQVSAKAFDIAHFLGYRNTIAERGSRTKAYVVSREVFAQKLLDYYTELGLLKSEMEKNELAEAIARMYGTSVDEINRRRKQRREVLGSFVKDNLQGFFLNGNIYIVEGLDKEEEQKTLEHELIHALTSKGERGGFQEYGNQKHHEINEAVTQTLTLAYQHKKSPYELFKAVINGDIVTSYRKEVEIILVALAASEHTEKPVTYKELAGMLADGNVYFCMMELINRCPDNIRAKVDKLISSFGL